MAYCIEAIISSQSALEVHAAKYASAAVVPLNGGFALIPVTEALLDELGTDGATGQFCKFTPAIAEWLRAISESAPAAYVEAEFFGGAGGQNATVWAEGEEFLPATRSFSAINLALKNLGFGRGSAFDEFEAIGLDRYRHTDAWLVDALPKSRATES